MTILILFTSRTPMEEREQEGGQREENDSETALVSDSVPVRSETSAESAVVPAVIVNEELDRKETDSGMCHHNSVAIRLCVTEKSIESEHF